MPPIKAFPKKTNPFQAKRDMGGSDNGDDRAFPKKSNPFKAKLPEKSNPFKAKLPVLTKMLIRMDFFPLEFSTEWGER